MNRKQDNSKKSIVIRTTAAFSGEGDIDRMIFEDIESNMPNNRHIFSRMVFSDTAKILMKGHIQTPMEGIFNAPMFPHGICESRYYSRLQR